jgi:hypothetical protein
MYTVGRLSERETSNGEGVEFVSDTLTPEGLRVTKKLYHLSSRLPLFVRLVLPKTAMVLTEDAWRSTAAGTSCTEIRNEYMAQNLTLRVETKVFECDDASRPNVFELDAARLKLREVQDIDWVAEETPAPDDKDYNAAEDARVFRSAKSRRHPNALAADWRATTLAAADKKKHPWICVYKLLTFEFKWFGIQTRAESFLVGWERNLFTKSQRLTWCLQDEWHDMTQEQIEEYLDTIAARINKQFRKASGAEESDTKQVTDGTAASTTTTAATDTADDKEKHHRHHHHHHSQHHHHHDSKGDEENEKEKSPTSKKTSSRRKKKRSTKANDAAAPAASSTADDDDNNASAEDDDAASASK